MIKVVGIGGEPAVGKTTTVLRLLESLGWPEGWKRYKTGLLCWLECQEHRLIVLGVYQKGETFAGTDRLSMAVQPDALGILGSWKGTPAMKDWSVLFEGDRLFNSSFLTTLEQDKGFDCRWFLLTANLKILSGRHKDRKDGQTDVWLKGRRTKLENLTRKLKKVRTFLHETEEDQEVVLSELRRALKG